METFVYTEQKERETLKLTLEELQIRTADEEVPDVHIVAWNTYLCVHACVYTFGHVFG